MQDYTKLDTVTGQSGAIYAVYTCRDLTGVAVYVSTIIDPAGRTIYADGAPNSGVAEDAHRTACYRALAL